MPTSVYDEFMALYPEGTGFDPLQATQVYPFLAKHMGIMLPRAGQDGSLRAAEDGTRCAPGKGRSGCRSGSPAAPMQGLLPREH